MWIVYRLILVRRIALSHTLIRASAKTMSSDVPFRASVVDASTEPLPCTSERAFGTSGGLIYHKCIYSVPLGGGVPLFRSISDSVLASPAMQLLSKPFECRNRMCSWKINFEAFTHSYEVTWPLLVRLAEVEKESQYLCTCRCPVTNDLHRLVIVRRTGCGHSSHFNRVEILIHIEGR